MTWLLQLSTLLGLALACGGIAAWLWLPHETVLHALSVVLSPVLIVVSDERFRRVVDWALDLAPKLFTRLRPSTNSSKFSNSSTQESTMSVITSISEIVAEAPDFIKAVEDGITIFSDVKSKGLLAGYTDLQKFEPDLVKVYNDILALGVTKAIAAGTVTPAQVS